MQPLLGHDKRLRKVAVVDCPVDVLFGKALVDRRLVIQVEVGLEHSVRHFHVAERRAAVDEERLGQVGPGREENHRSQIAKDSASVWRTGKLPSS